MRFILGLILGASLLMAQDESDAIRPFAQEFGPGARAMALGGAYVGIAEDYTAVYWNPAGLAQLRRIEFHTGLLYNKLKNQIDYQSLRTSTSNKFTYLNTFGMAIPVPTTRGSLVLAIGYHRLSLFDSFSDIKGLPVVSSKTFTQNERVTEEGKTSAWAFSGAVDLTKNLSVGGTLNIITGNYTVNSRYSETDPNDVLTRQSFTGQFRIKPEYSGVNFKMGAIFRPIMNMRLGATLTTASSISTEETSNYSETNIDDNSTEDNFSEESFRKYKITSPWKFEFGGSYKYQNYTLTGAVEYTDWTQSRFNSNILDENDAPIDPEINDAFRTQFRTSGNYKVGLEAIVPSIGAKIMTGYAYHESPYKPSSELVNTNKQYFSLGSSFLIDEQVKVDFGYQYGWWKQASTSTFLGEDPVTNSVYFTKEKLSAHRFLISVSYRF